MSLMFMRHPRVPARFFAVLGALTGTTLLLFLARAPVGATAPELSGHRVRAHVEFLGDDLLEGREAGTRGFDIAARYGATQLKLAGFSPAADDGTYFQTVPLRRTTLTASSLSAGPSGSALTPLRVPDQAMVMVNSRQAQVDLTAPLAYVGYGVTAPTLKHDDYAGLDVTGRVAVVLFNAPEAFPTELRAHFGSSQQKLRMAADHGAVGVIIVIGPQDESRFPWERMKQYLRAPQYSTVQPDGQAAMAEPRISALAYVNRDGFTRLLQGAPFTADEAFAAAQGGRSLSAALPSVVRISATSAHEDTSSENVAGRLEGSDPALSGSSVLLTAHLDHLGVDPTRGDDKIFNGVYDNATGCATVLEVAHAFGTAATRPRRSVIVVLFTGEEKGLLGSDYMARNPLKAAGRVVADINLDMAVFMTAARDVVAFGREDSTLAPVIERAAAAEGFTLSPDPMPEQNIFVRSDQYSFVKRGIPSTYLFPGFTATDPRVNGREVFESYLHGHYHQPSDDLSLPFDEAAAGRFASLNYRIAREVADDPVAPSWNPGDFFGETFGK
jgi:Zn-dependent M28 family amino/carboxypeptidase